LTFSQLAEKSIIKEKVVPVVEEPTKVENKGGVLLEFFETPLPSSRNVLQKDSLSLA